MDAGIKMGSCNNNDDDAKRTGRSRCLETGI
jgi:hypothetical protein